MAKQQDNKQNKTYEQKQNAAKQINSRMKNKTRTGQQQTFHPYQNNNTQHNEQHNKSANGNTLNIYKQKIKPTQSNYKKKQLKKQFTHK